MTLALKNTETEPVPTHRGAHPEIAPSATRSAPAAEPNEADLLPALDSGREKLLSPTEVESTLKDWPTQEQASLKEQAEEKAASEVAIAAAAEDAEEMELKAAAKRLRRLRKNQKMEEEATEWLARTLALVLQQAQSSEPSVALQLPIPRMQAKMATRSSDDDEDTSLPRMPWQTAAGPAWLYDRYHRLRFGELKDRYL